jgi:hypothetical protein
MEQERVKIELQMAKERETAAQMASKSRASSAGFPPRLQMGIGSTGQ